MRPKWMLSPCAKSTAAPGSRFGCDLGFVHALLHVVGQEHRDELRAADRIARCERDRQARASAARSRRRAALAQADLDLDARVAQVERVRVALAAVADHGHLAGEQVEVAFAVDRRH